MQNYAKNMLQIMAEKLSENDTYFLKKIYAPTQVAVPPKDAVRHMMLCKDGEIRVYGMIDQTSPHKEDGDTVYLSSHNCGLSWNMVKCDPAALGSSVYDPKTDRYVSFFYIDNAERKGLFFQSAVSPDSTEIRYVKMSNTKVVVERLPILLIKKDRILCVGQVYDDQNVTTPVILYSDDHGETWRETTLSLAPKHEITYPHKGYRWQNYSCEATVCELEDKLLAIVRTSQDVHYRSYSYDFGATWTPVEPSEFHSTLTMPTLKRLSDGTILFCWCNTQPLPELDHAEEQPECTRDECTGYWEDLFTNRDAAHLAISSDDGATWQGFREFHLNTVRNHSDFRSVGGIADGQDKSVHQSEILELPYNKLLISSGQHSISRRLILLDRDWLLERSRSEDFRYGLSQWSTHTYLKSISGCYRHFSGHCAWNRTHGAVLMAAPGYPNEEALFLSVIEDPRLYSPTQGAVWNFPAAKKGEVNCRIKICGEGLRLSLLDRWMNPIDPYVAEYAAATLILTNGQFGGDWFDLTLRFDTVQKTVSVFADQKECYRIPIEQNAENGLSYLHFQTVATQSDPKGAYVKTVDMTAL